MQTIKRVGGSLMVRIPAELVREDGLVEGQKIRLTYERPRKDWFGALKGIGRWKKEDKLDIKDF